MYEQDLKPNKGAKQRKQRVGRGDGSGRGNYSGRGMNGQSCRSGGKRRPGFEGGQTPLYQKMPKLKGFKNPNRVEYQIVNLSSLDIFNDGDTVDINSLLAKGLIKSKVKPIKLLGNGEVTKKLTIKVDTASKSAIEKAEKSGITVEITAPKKPKTEKKEKSKKKGAKANKTEPKNDKEETPIKEDKEDKKEDTESTEGK